MTRLKTPTTVFWPVRPDWMLQNACVDMELLNIKHRNKTQEYMPPAGNWKNGISLSFLLYTTPDLSYM